MAAGGEIVAGVLLVLGLFTPVAAAGRWPICSTACWPTCRRSRTLDHFGSSYRADTNTN
ncbi:doxX family protein [Mycobacterium xenopi 3993]|nr:doxX family protein [Mycobacterium xenopi 3993]